MNMICGLILLLLKPILNALCNPYSYPTCAYIVLSVLLQGHWGHLYCSFLFPTNRWSPKGNREMLADFWQSVCQVVKDWGEEMVCRVWLLPAVALHSSSQTLKLHIPFGSSHYYTQQGTGWSSLLNARLLAHQTSVMYVWTTKSQSTSL